MSAQSFKRNPIAFTRRLASPSSMSIPPKTPSSIPLAEQIKEVRREIELRERLYPQWVSVGTLSSIDAEERFNRMRAVLETLLKLTTSQTSGVS
jgi:hypothetical protein